MVQPKYTAIKDSNGFYYNGMRQWVKQLRNAKFYKSRKYAVEALQSNRKEGLEYFLISVVIEETGEQECIKECSSV